MKTNFTEVSKFNELIGNAKGSANIGQIAKQFELIESEFEELRASISRYCLGRESIESGDYRPEEVFGVGGYSEALCDIRDGIADVLVTTYGLAHRMGIDADDDMAQVQASNMSKFFEGTDTEAQSVEYALSKSLGIKVERRQSGNADQQDAGDAPTRYVWAFVSADDSDPERPRGKLLKAPGFKKPKFEI